LIVVLTPLDPLNISDRVFASQLVWMVFGGSEECGGTADVLHVRSSCHGLIHGLISLSVTAGLDAQEESGKEELDSLLVWMVFFGGDDKFELFLASTRPTLPFCQLPSPFCVSSQQRSPFDCCVFFWLMICTINHQ
jgi:hypothetical protein